MQRGVRVPRGLGDADGDAVSAREVRRCGLVVVQRVQRRAVRRDVWADQQQLQWTVSRGSVRQHQWRDDVSVQRRVSGGVCVSRRDRDLRRQRVPRWNVQHRWVVDVHELQCGLVRRSDRVGHQCVHWAVSRWQVWS